MVSDFIFSSISVLGNHNAVCAINDNDLDDDDDEEDFYWSNFNNVRERSEWNSAALETAPRV